MITDRHRLLGPATRVIECWDCGATQTIGNPYFASTIRCPECRQIGYVVGPYDIVHEPRHHLPSALVGEEAR